jgi:hypothetical protein
LIALLGWSSTALAGNSTKFPFHDASLLLRSQKDGGMVYVPETVSSGESAPLVVFLHGLNDQQEVHLWLGAGPYDLRTQWDTWLVEGGKNPALLAAPSQTRHAGGATNLWRDFDLDEFVESVDLALGGSAYVDRAKVMLVGHSGAGCNSSGGLARVSSGSRSIRPLAIVAIDVCMDQDAATTLALTPSEIPVAVYWQTAWPRPFDDFRFAFDVLRGHETGTRNIVEEVSVTDRDAHNSIVPVALSRALTLFLPPAEQAPP